MTDDDAQSKIINGSLPDFDMLKQLFQRVKTNRFYGTKFSGKTLESWEDFFSLPLTTKEELRDCSPRDILAVPIEKVWHYHETFGTTGRPITTWFTRADYEHEVRITRDWTVPLKPGSIIINRLPYSLAVPPFIVEMKGMIDGGVVIPAGNLNWNVSYARTLDIMHRVEVDAIACFPLEMVILDLLAEKCGYQIEKDFGSLNHVLVSGRVIPDVLREYIERHWNAKIWCVYGLSEAGGVASMCSSGRLHLHHDTMILELLDIDSGEHVSSGDPGLLVATSYYREASPLVRYNTRDICRVYTDDCACGNPEPAVEVLGRMDNTIELSGKRIFFTCLEQSILELAKELDSAIYFVIVTDNGLLIRVESRNGNRQVSKEALSKLKDTLAVPLKVSICKKSELLDLNNMLRFPNVYKPHNVSDWRYDHRRCVNLSEGLIEWPHVGFTDLIDMSSRFIKNAILRKILK